MTKMQISTNLCHCRGAIDKFTPLSGFPSNLGFLLQFLQSSLVNVFLLFEKFCTCEKHLDRSLIFAASQLALHEFFMFGW